MTSLIAFLALAHPIDGEDAVGIARRFLVGMDVRRPGGLEGLFEQSASAWGQPGTTVWSIAFGRSAEEYYVSVAQDGTVFRAGRSDGGVGLTKNLDAATAKRLSKRLMDRVPKARPVRSHRPPESMYADGQFEVLVNGLTFFNINPTYGYSIGCAPDGYLVRFTRLDRTPPVVPAKPRIAHRSAVERLTRVWGKKPHDGYLPQHIRADLGYYIRKNEKTARLVWRGWVYMDRNPLFDGAGMLEDYLDAMTGEIFRRDDN